MEKLKLLIDDLSKPVFLNLSTIIELNHAIGLELKQILITHAQFQTHTQTRMHALMYVLNKLAKFGSKLECEFKFDSKCDSECDSKCEFGYDKNLLVCMSNTDSFDIVQYQLGTFRSLVKPICMRLREICFELNIQIVDNIKFELSELYKLNTNQDRNRDQDQNQDKDQDIAHNIIHDMTKLLNVTSSIKNYYNTRHKEIPFDEFGVNIKISSSNPCTKSHIVNLINHMDIFSQPHEKILLRKYDWVWNVFDDCDNVYNSKLFTNNKHNNNNDENIDKHIDEHIDKHNNNYRDLMLVTLSGANTNTDVISSATNDLSIKIKNKTNEKYYVIKNDTNNNIKSKIIVEKNNVNCERDECDDMKSNVSEQNDIFAFTQVINKKKNKKNNNRK